MLRALPLGPSWPGLALAAVVVCGVCAVAYRGTSCPKCGAHNTTNSGAALPADNGWLGVRPHGDSVDGTTAPEFGPTSRKERE